MLRQNHIPTPPAGQGPAPAELIDLNHLAGIRAFIEGCKRIESINDDMRELVESRWPDLASKLPRKLPESDPR